MPCTYDESYAEARDREKFMEECNLVHWLLLEVNGGTVTDEQRGGKYPNPRGGNVRWYHDDLERATAELCGKLKDVEDVTRFSLELQLWWKRHQLADANREAKDAKERNRTSAIASALSKLTDEEKRALGITVREETGP
jgi:hypothetical protein